MSSLTDLLLYPPGVAPPPDPEPPPLPSAMAPALAGAVAYGPAPNPGPPISVHLLDYTFEEITEFDLSKNRQWHDEADDKGSGSLVLANTDPDLTLLAPKQIVQFRLHGWAAFAMLARSADAVIRDPNEEAQQLTTIHGEGHIAKLDKSNIEPPRGWGTKPTQDDRLFSWPSVEYNDAGWITALQLVSVADAKATEWPTRPMGNGFPDAANAFMIWAPGTPTATPFSAPVGDCYFRNTFEVASTGNIIMYLLIDNFGDVYIDGMAVEQVQIGDGYINATPIVLTVSAGEHTIAIKATNVTEGSPGAVAIAIYDADASGAPASPTPILVSDSTWKMVAYPTSPLGMTAGRIANVILDEAESAGTSPSIQRNWTDELDTNGNPWDIVPGFTTRVGNDLFTVLARELGGTYVDIHMAPVGWEMSLYRIGERGRDVDVNFHAATDPQIPATGNLLSLRSEGDLEPITELAVRWRDNWVIVSDEDAVALYGRNRGTLGLTAASEEEAVATAREQLAIFARLRAQVTGQVRDDPLARPYWSWQTCDRVLCDQDAANPPTQEREKVLSISVSEDDDGTVTIVPMMRDLMREAQVRHERAIKKIGLGTLDGRSDVANPVSLVASSGGSCCAPAPPDVIPPDG